MARIDLFLDHELDPALADEIDRHLADCEHCCDEANVGSVIRQAVQRTYQPEPAPPALLHRITEWLHTVERRGAR